MAENTKIEWCDHTFNPWVGCTKVSPACDHCYAEAWAKRAGRDVWGAGKPRQRTTDANWRQPLKWNAEAARTGTRPRVFCASLADVFDNEVDPEWRADLFRLIAATPDLDWLLLTKRIGNVMNMVNGVAGLSRLGSHAGHLMAHHWRNGTPPPNVWLGATVVNQEEADRDIPKLLVVPAAKRFLSIEPMLGPVDIETIRNTDFGEGQPYLHPLIGLVGDGHGDSCRAPAIDWVIVGGESGHGARPMHPDWARSLRDQCQSAGVPLLFKQWGEWLPGQNDVHPHANGRRVAHHQDGSWGVTNRQVNASNYVTWDESGSLHRGSLKSAPSHRRVHAWAQRVGKKTAGRLLDGRTWDEFPA